MPRSAVCCTPTTQLASADSPESAGNCIATNGYRALKSTRVCWQIAHLDFAIFSAPIMRPTRSLIVTLLLAALALALTLPNGNGALLPMVLAGLLIYFIYQAIVMVRRPAERPRRRVKLVVWAAVALIASAAQGYWSSATQRGAESALQGIEAYRARHGVYPPSLAEAGLDEPALRDDWGIRYRLEAGRPRLSYPATLMWLTTLDYDFAAKRWRPNAY